MSFTTAHKDIIQLLTSRISNRLAQGEERLTLTDLVVDAARDRIDDDDAATNAAYELLDDVIPSKSSLLVSFGYEDALWTALELLDLGTNHIHVLIDRSQIDEGCAVIAEFPRSDVNALRDFVRSEMAFGAATGETLSAWPEGIEVGEPITAGDVLDAFTGLLVPHPEECERLLPQLSHATGSTWSVESRDDRTLFTEAYVAMMLGLDIPVADEEPRLTGQTKPADNSQSQEHFVAQGCDSSSSHTRNRSADAPVESSEGDRETLNNPPEIVRDPVSGRPLHEFVVDPLAAPTVLPTEGSPLDEPGVQQAPHGDTRKDPVLVFTVSRDLDIDQAVKAMSEVIKDARRKLAERRQG